MKKSIVFIITGSSCCYSKVQPLLQKLVKSYNVLPLMSEHANKDTRFVNAAEFAKQIESICKNKISYTICEAEKFSSNKDIVCAVVCPATGNTIAKLNNAITDTSALMAVKAITRNNKPCVVAVSTNDGISNNFANIASLLNKKNYYFVPFNQDDAVNKPNSLVCNFDLVKSTIDAAIEGKQLQPIIYKN